MQTSPAFQPAAVTPPGSAAAPRRLVIDAPTRMFHWLFALSFLGAYVTAESERWRALHVTLGYTLAGLLAFRVLYGLLGPRHAGLGQLTGRLAGAKAWTRSLVQGLRQGSVHRAPWRQGQNLLMALAVLAMLLLVVPLTLSGYGTYNDWGNSLGGDGLEDLHGFLGQAFLLAALVHIALIAGASLLRRRNLALPMLTGRIDGAGPDRVKRNPVWLAVVLLAAALGFIGWQWQPSPQGLMPAQGSAPAGPDRHHDDDD